MQMQLSLARRIILVSILVFTILLVVAVFVLTNNNNMKSNSKLESTSYEEAFNVNANDDSLEYSFKENVSIDILEVDKQEKAKVDVTMPDLINIYNQVIKEASGKTDDQILDEIKSNMQRHTFTVSTETSVTNKDGKWQLEDPETIDTLINQEIDKFLLNSFKEVKFTPFSVDEMKEIITK